MAAINSFKAPGPFRGPHACSGHGADTGGETDINVLAWIADTDVHVFVHHRQPPVGHVGNVGEGEAHHRRMADQVFWHDAVLQIEHQQLHVVDTVCEVLAWPAHAPIADLPKDGQWFFAGRSGEVLVAPLQHVVAAATHQPLSKDEKSPFLTEDLRGLRHGTELPILHARGLPQLDFLICRL